MLLPLHCPFTHFSWPICCCIIVSWVGISTVSMNRSIYEFPQQLIPQIPYVKFILPTAPIHPVTLYGGESMTSWYDIMGFHDKFEEPCHGILESRDRIQTILTKEHQRTGIPFSRMVLAGHSQGGSVSLFTGLTLPVHQKLAGILVLSGYLASGQHTFQFTSGLEDTPILHCHGIEDTVVVYDMAKRSKDLLLTTYGVHSYTIKSYPMGHNISDEELHDALTFLRTVLAPLEETDYPICSSTE
jgi:predicted esterase